MKKGFIRNLTAVIALTQVFSLSAHAINENGDIDLSEEFGISSYEDSIILSSTGHLYAKYIDFDLNNFVDIEKPQTVITYFESGVYSLDGVYYKEIKSNTRSKLLKKDPETELLLIKLPSGQEVIIGEEFVFSAPDYETSPFTQIEDNNERIMCDYCFIYDENGQFIGFAGNRYECEAIKTNGDYTYIKMKPNEYENSGGIEGYVENKYLAYKFDNTKYMAYSNRDTKIYSDILLSTIVDNIEQGRLLDIVYITNDYTCIKINEETYLYMKTQDIDLVDRPELDNEMKLTIK